MTTNLLPTLYDHASQHIITALAREGPLRFAALGRATQLDNKTLAERLKTMRQQMVVTARTIPSRGERIWLEYRLTPRGEALLGVLHDLRDGLAKRRRALGSAPKQFEEIFQTHTAA